MLSGTCRFRPEPPPVGLLADFNFENFDDCVESCEGEDFADCGAGVENLDLWRIFAESGERDEQSQHATWYERDAGEIKGCDAGVLRAQQVTDSSAIVCGVEF